MKKLWKKLIVCMMVILVLFNFMCTAGGSLGDVFAEEDTSEANQVVEEVEEEAGGQINGIASFLIWAARAMVVMVGTLFQTLGYFVVSSAGTSDGSTSSSIYFSPFDIFFNTFTLTNVNVFKTDDLPTDSSGNVDTDGLVYSFRSAVAGLYRLTSGIALAILFALLILSIAKRILESTPEKQKEAAQAMTDCIYKLAIIVFADLIVILVLLLNETIIDLLYQFGEGLEVSEFIKNLRSAALGDNYILGIGSCIAFFVVCWQTFKFTIAYILRFFMVSLLIVIAPLMGLFYSHSKSAQGMPGAFNKWFKLFVSNVFIQSIDCLLYLMCVAIPLASTINNAGSIVNVSSLCGAVMLVAGVMFVKQGEKVLMKLIGLEDSVISMNSVSNGISNAVHTVSNTALTGVAIGQGNYSVMNVTNSPVSFGNNIQGAAGAGSSTGFPAGADSLIHEAKGTSQKEFDDKSNENEIEDKEYSNKNSTQNKDGQGASNRRGLESVIGGLIGASAATAAGVAANVATDVDSEDDKALSDKLDEELDDKLEGGQDEFEKELDDKLKGGQDEFEKELDDKLKNLGGKSEDETETKIENNESSESNVETESENNRYEREETSTNEIHMVPEQDKGETVTQEQKAASDFVSKHDACIERNHEIEAMYEQNRYRYDSKLESVQGKISSGEIEEIRKKVSDLLAEGDERFGEQYTESSINKVRDYIKSLGNDSVQGKVATAALEYKDSDKRVEAAVLKNINDYDENVDKAVSKNIISKEEGRDLKNYGMRVNEYGLEEETANARNTIESLRQFSAGVTNAAAIATVNTTGATTTDTSTKPSTTKQETEVETKIDPAVLKRLSENSQFKELMTEIGEPLKVINSTSTKAMDGKIDVSYEAMSQIAGRVEHNFNYDAAIDEIRKQIEAEGANRAAEFEKFCDADSAEKATEAAKSLTTDAQKEGARLVVESKMAGAMTLTSSLISQQTSANVQGSSQTQSTLTSGVGNGQPTPGNNSSTQNVLNQLAENGRKAAETEKK